MAHPKAESYEVNDGRLGGEGGEVGSLPPVVPYPHVFN